jgi:hypothetical protein
MLTDKELALIIINDINASVNILANLVQKISIYDNNKIFDLEKNQIAHIIYDGMEIGRESIYKKFPEINILDEQFRNSRNDENEK